MIHGIGTDIAEVKRFASAIERHGDQFAERVLAAGEVADYHAAADPARFLAKRFAAKEAFGKALGTGVRAPATLHAMWIEHDGLGKPVFAFSPALAEHLGSLGLRAHLSLSDEAAYAVAFVILERAEP